jgi:hypothetical protein
MTMGLDNARELVDSLLTFDNVGDAMMAVRRDLNSISAQEQLIKEIFDIATRLIGDTSPGNLEIIGHAARVRVKQFVEGSKAGGTGCGGL